MLYRAAKSDFLPSLLPSGIVGWKAHSFIPLQCFIFRLRDNKCGIHATSLREIQKKSLTLILVTVAQDRGIWLQ